MSILYYFSKLIKYLHIPSIYKCNIHRKAKVCPGCHMSNTTLDRYSYVGGFCTIIHAEIGMFCSIADNCVIGGASHPIDWVSSSPLFHQGKNVLHKNFAENEFRTSQKTRIGNDVWIGSNSIIKGGATIGNGSIVGMGSVVTRDIGDYEIWAGNPAKLIRMRFPEDIANTLKEVEWWNWDDDTLEEHGRSFNDVTRFIELTYKKVQNKDKRNK